jgi:hypothetical protein
MYSKMQPLSKNITSRDIENKRHLKTKQQCKTPKSTTPRKIKTKTKYN